MGHFLNSNMAEAAKNPEIWKAACMLDHFDKIQKLKDKIDGVPNFRRVPGYKVYCCGQPTIDGFTAAIEKACGEKWPKDGPIIWLNMRQEPIVYVNGSPCCARPPNKIGETLNLEMLLLNQLKLTRPNLVGCSKKGLRMVENVKSLALLRLRAKLKSRKLSP